jgi:acetolactate synthase-1/2/3 large subunit
MLYDMIVPPAPPAPAQIPRFGPSKDTLEALKARIAEAKHPLVMAGGGGWTPKGIKALQSFAEVQNLPVAVSLRSQGLMNNDHLNYVGHFGVGVTPYLAEAIKQTDLLIAIGPRLGEMTTGGYTLLEPPVPHLSLAHVFPAGEEIGRVYEPEISLVSDTETFCSLAAGWDPIAPDRFASNTLALREKYVAFNTPASVGEDPLAPFFAHLAKTLPADAIVCNGAGNYAGWLHRFYRYRAPGSQLAPTSGSMGYGLPAAVGAAVCQPKREVYALAGDGCFLMTSQEMATAVHHKLNLTVIILNNSRYGTIRAHQEREFPDRISGTDLTNPDFCAFARSFGAEAHRTPDFESFSLALDTARSTGGVHVIEVPMEPTLLAPGKRLS